MERDFPVVLKNRIRDWNLVNYTKEDWCRLFKDKVLKFREGKKTYTETPYWESLCKSKEMSLSDFFETSSQNSDSWLYFDYKYVEDVFPQSDKFVNELKWADVGLSDYHGEESALWIGNEGAHTPCHRDTYGFNLVAQLFGRKLWILIPPEETENLNPVRVPYEESSVYTLFNFYTPNKSLLNIKQAYKVILCPGDILYVPRHWWHYVENLELAISVNIWVPMEEDYETRLEESLIQHYVSNICLDLTEEEAKQILNPNEHNLILKPSTLGLVEKCLESYKNHKKEYKEDKKIQFSGDVGKIENLSIDLYLKEKCKKQDPSSSMIRNVSKRLFIAQTLINSYCSQYNINLIKNALLER